MAWPRDWCWQRCRSKHKAEGAVVEAVSDMKTLEVQTVSWKVLEMHQWNWTYVEEANPSSKQVVGSRGSFYRIEDTGNAL